MNVNGNINMILAKKTMEVLHGGQEADESENENEKMSTLEITTLRSLNMLLIKH